MQYPVPDRIRTYRETFRNERVPKRYHGWIHFFGMSLACIALFFFLLARVQSPTWLELLTIPLTFLYANLIEYWGHRGPLHHRLQGAHLMFQVHTGEHHRFFTHEAMGAESHRDFFVTLFTPATFLFFMGGFALPPALLAGFYISRNVGLLLFLTSLAYFLNYEFLHLAYHLPDGHWVRKIPWVDRLRIHHLAHHNPGKMQRLHFNVTYPIADRMFKTFR